MAPTRRGFLASLAAAMVIDPERLLWVPGKKMISIARPPIREVTWWRVPIETFGGGCFQRFDPDGGSLGCGMAISIGMQLFTEMDVITRYGCIPDNAHRIRMEP